MRHSATFRAGFTLVRTPSARDSARRRGRIIAAVLGLALAAGVTGSLIHPDPSRSLTGPFSYFPHQ